MRVCSAFWAVTLLSFSTLANGASIVVVNPSFETMPAGGLNDSSTLGLWDVGSVPGWTESGDAPMGQYQASGLTFNKLDDGSTIGFANAGGTLSQDVGRVTAGSTYILSVDIGQRLDIPSTVSADLLVNGVAYAAIGTQAMPGGWATFTATYTALSSDINDIITIQLKAFAGQGDFDNISLIDPPDVPEPASAALLGACLAALAGRSLYRRRRLAS